MPQLEKDGTPQRRPGEAKKIIKINKIKKHIYISFKIVYSLRRFKEKKWQHTAVFLPGQLLGPRSLEGYSAEPEGVGHD